TRHDRCIANTNSYCSISSTWWVFMNRDRRAVFYELTASRCLASHRNFTEVLLQDQRDGAAQPGHSIFVNRYDARRNAARKNLRLNLGFDDGAEAAPGPRQIADNENALRRQSGDDHAHAAAEILRHPVQGSAGLRVALVGKGQEMLKTQAGM